MTDMSPNLLPERVVRRARRRWIVASAIVLAALIIALVAWLALRPSPAQAPTGDVAQRGAKGGPGGGAARPMPVVAAPARTADVGIYPSGLGSVTPIATVTVKSRVD